jgi:hypothetical protein
MSDAFVGLLLIVRKCTVQNEKNAYEKCFFFSKKLFSDTASFTQENRHFIVQIGKNKRSQWTKLPRTCIT